MLKPTTYLLPELCMQSQSKYCGPAAERVTWRLFPRSIERGPVEASRWACMACLTAATFPRSIERGPVEAVCRNHFAQFVH